jgi:hypothetical protein
LKRFNPEPLIAALELRGGTRLLSACTALLLWVLMAWRKSSQRHDQPRASLVSILLFSLAKCLSMRPVGCIMMFGGGVDVEAPLNTGALPMWTPLLRTRMLLDV